MPLDDAAVAALAAGRKTQLRWPVAVPGWTDRVVIRREGGSDAVVVNAIGRHPELGGTCRVLRCPLGEPGDRLWVREAFAPRLDVDPAEELAKARHYALYRANGTSLDEPHWHSYPDRWVPTAKMPRWASRFTLEVVAVRVERLQSIAASEIVAEGFHPIGPEHPPRLLRDEFSPAWDRVNARRGYPWSKNPWVWVVTFRREEP